MRKALNGNMSDTIMFLLAGTLVISAATNAELAWSQLEEDSSVIVTFGADEWMVPVNFTSGNITSARVDADFHSLILSLATDPLHENELVLALPRNLIDARLDESDSEFIVVADDRSIPYDEIQTSDSSRQIRIVLPPGVSEVEIVGTQVVPEFPGIVFMCVVIFLATAVLYHRKRSLVLD
jgi:hypothetical protein